MTIVWLIRIVLTAVCLTVVAILLDRMAARSRGWLARSRRWIWGSAMVLSVLLPAISAFGHWGHPLLSILLRWPITYHTTAKIVTDHSVARAPNPAVVSGAIPKFQSITSDIVRTLGEFQRPIVLTCVGISILGLILLGVAHLWIYMRQRQWVHESLDGVDVLVTPAVGPAVVGVMSPKIVIPLWVLGAKPETQHAILEHERAHISAGDSRMLAVGAFVLALMPWNLALWWQYRRLRLTVETDCDARVLARGVDVRQYGEMLLGVATRAISVPLLSPAFCANLSLIERRIVAMTRIRTQYSRLQFAIYGTAAAMAVLAAFDTSSRQKLPLVTSMQLLASSPLVVREVPIPNNADTGATMWEIIRGTFDVQVQIGGNRVPRPAPVMLSSAETYTGETVQVGSKDVEVKEMSYHYAIAALPPSDNQPRQKKMHLVVPAPPRHLSRAATELQLRTDPTIKDGIVEGELVQFKGVMSLTLQ